MKTKRRAKAQPARDAASSALPSTRLEQRLVAGCLLVAVAGVALLPFQVGVSPPTLVSMLCLVLTAGAGWALRRPAAPADRQGAAPPAWCDRWAVPLVFVVALLPYLSTLWLGFLSDDWGIVDLVGKRHLPSLFRFSRISSLYRGAHLGAWWWQYQMWGWSAVGYHAVNLALHGASAVLVYLLGRRLAGPRAALLAALLFGLHPLHVEAVAWSCGQVDLQATLFALLSLLCVDTYLFARSASAARMALLGAAGCFLLCLLTKESGLALPGVAVVWAWARQPWPGWRRPAAAGAAYGVVLAGYLGARLVALGGIGGYFLISSFWNTWFPSAPLRALHAFFFPLPPSVFLALPWWLGRWAWWAAAGLMAAALFAVARGLGVVPGRRLALYAAFPLLLAIPVWQLFITSDLEGSRFAYLPTIGLAWLVGEVLAALHTRRGRVLRAVALVGAGLLCLWFVMPWHAAARMASQPVRAAARVIAEAPPSDREPVFYFQGLPDTYCGAQVCRNGFGVAVGRVLGRQPLVQTVSVTGDMPQEALTLSTLQPGEYVYEWKGPRRGMVLVRSGERDAAGGRL